MTFAFQEVDSPAGRLMGSVFRKWDAESATITFEYTPPPEFSSPRGAVQGGLVCGFLDEVMGAALYASGEGKLLPLNLDMTVSYLRPVPFATLLGKGRVVKRGARVAFLEGELFDPEGNLLVRASSTAIPTQLPEAES